MKQILEALFAGAELSFSEAKRVMLGIADGVYPAVQIAAFLSACRMRPVGIHELRGFREGLLERALLLDLGDFEPIDLCGTGGDGLNTFNISTTASFVVAGAGVRVAKHGNHGVSSSCGSSTVLEALGVRFSADSAVIRRQIEKAGICFLHAPLFHPSLKQVAPIRKELGVRTFFNLLGPLVNPARPVTQLIGVANLETARLFRYALEGAQRRFVVVHSLDGYDEVSLTSPAQVLGPSREELLHARDFGYAPLYPADLHAGDTPAACAEIVISVLEGRSSAAQRSVVVANAALALTCALNKELHECTQLADESISSGRARLALRELVAHSAY